MYETIKYYYLRPSAETRYTPLSDINEETKIEPQTVITHQ